MPRLALTKETQQIAREIDEKKIEGFFQHIEGELMYHLAASLPKDAHIVEIGSWKGRSTSWMGRAIKDKEGAMIYAIDPHVGSEEHQQNGPIYTFANFEQNIKAMGVEEKVTPIVKFSSEAAHLVPKEIDLLFIDGAHDYKNVLADYENFAPKLKCGGIIAFHDSAGKGWPGVHRVVKEKIFNSNSYTQARFIGSITYAVKVSQNTYRERLQNQMAYRIKCMHDHIHRFPKFVKNCERLITYKLFQRAWLKEAAKLYTYNAHT